MIAKIREELEELEAEIDGGSGKERLRDETGDLLFACVNLARHLGIDAEIALRDGNAKFERRFRAVENGLEQAGKSLQDADLAEMESHWVAAKADEPSN